MIIKSFYNANGGSPKDIPMNDSSNDLPWRTVSRHSLVRISVNSEGVIDICRLESLLCRYNHDRQFGKKRISLVAVNGASNVLGTCNDLAEIGRIVHR